MNRLQLVFGYSVVLGVLVGVEVLRRRAVRRLVRDIYAHIYRVV